MNTHRAQREPRWEPASPGSTARTMVPSPLDSIEPGEVEHDIWKGQDWTEDWTSLLYMRNRAKHGELWVSDACLYFRGLSPERLEPIPWDDPSRTMRVPRSVLPAKSPGDANFIGCTRFTWPFQKGSGNPRWGGSFTVYY